MTYHDEVAKEYLRDAFHSGALDVTGSYMQLRGFVQIFSGEMDALVAINQCNSLDQGEIDRLMKLAAPTKETMVHYCAWLTRVHS